MKKPAHNRKNLIGLRFGLLTVIKRCEDRSYPSGTKTQYLCRCSCGNEIKVLTCSLSTGNTRSCGCIGKIKLITRNRTHGMTGIRAYRIWQAMLNRCRNDKTVNYQRYGGRGISVCDRWRDSFESFLEDMGHPDSGQSIDRKDNDGNYTPDNCKWSTRHEQCRNTSRNRILSLRGDEKILCDWANELGIDQTSLSERLENWSLEDALTRPKRQTMKRNGGNI